MKEYLSLNFSAWFSSLPHLSPYLTSFPTTPHYTPFTVVKPVSPRHLTISLGLSSCWNALLPLHLFILNIIPLLLDSFLKYLLNAHSVSGIMLSARLQQRTKHIGFLSPCCLLSYELSPRAPQLPLISIFSYIL